MKTILLNIMTCLSLTMTQCEQPNEAIVVAKTVVKTNYGYIIDTSTVKLDKRRIMETPFLKAIEYSMETSDFNNLKPVLKEFVNFEINVEGKKISQYVINSQIGKSINLLLKNAECNNVKLMRYKNLSDTDPSIYWLIGSNDKDPNSIKVNFYFIINNGVVETITVF